MQYSPASRLIYTYAQTSPNTIASIVLGVFCIHVLFALLLAILEPNATRGKPSTSITVRLQTLSNIKTQASQAQNTTEKATSSAPKVTPNKKTLAPPTVAPNKNTIQPQHQSSATTSSTNKPVAKAMPKNTPISPTQNKATTNQSTTSVTQITDIRPDQASSKNNNKVTPNKTKTAISSIDLAPAEQTPTAATRGTLPQAEDDDIKKSKHGKSAAFDEEAQPTTTPASRSASGDNAIGETRNVKLKSKNEEQDYPPEALEEGKEGKINVKASIDSSGNVIKTEVLNKDANIYLRNAAERYVKNKCKFLPALKNGEPVPGEIIVPVRFKLND